MKKSHFIILISIVIAVVVAIVLYFAYSGTPTPTDEIPTTNFNPFGTTPIRPQPTTNSTSTTQVSTTTNTTSKPYKMPKLRLLSATPVGGMFASTTRMKSPGITGTTTDATIVRFVDRGAGHIFQANNLEMNISKISNTTLPKIYESYWNKNLTAVIFRYLKVNTDTVTSFYSEIRPTATSTASSTTPYEIKGKYLSADIAEMAVSPAGDKIFTWNIENGNGAGYISSFDGKNLVKIIDSPLTQVNIDWPEANTVTFNTKGNSTIGGYSYSANAKTGSISKLLGGILGLSTKLSKDAKNLLYSLSADSKIKSGILNTTDRSSKALVFNTLADKCVWSNINKNELYCAVPTDIPDASYPEDWYKGKVAFVDQIWLIDAKTGEVHLLANPLDLANKLIDAEQLTLDPKENYLYFINKRDLSLWSLDLNQ